MILVELKTVIFKKQVEWGRSITVTEVAESTGISRMTLHRMLKDPAYNASTDHLNKLCEFLQCDLFQLIRWVPDRTATNTSVAA